MMAADKQKKLHAIMMPLPYQGHINPLVNLALKLASKGFTITFVHLEFVHHKISNHTKASTEVDLFSEVRKSGLDMRCIMISDDFPLEFDRDLHFPEYWNYLFRDFPAQVDEFIRKIIQSDPFSVYFLVVDGSYWWPATIAKKYNMVFVCFLTTAAMVFSLEYHWKDLIDKGHVPCKDDTGVKIDYIPGVQSLSTRDLMTYITEEDSIVREALFVAFQEAKKADFILHNTVYELESETLSVLNKYQPNYAIGPINFYKNPATNNVSKSLRSASDCIHWLDSKSPGSVLYVSFGSLVQTSKQAVQEIAYGLLLSEVDFIWIVRDNIVDPGEPNILPAGYEDQVKEKGLIIPWCDQIQVLSNSAVRGFLTHNGWNSTIESMWCGVPMLCFPITYDQTTNRKLVVDVWKSGIDLYDGTSVNRKEVAEKIKSFMSSGGAYSSLRQEADKVKGILQNALEIDGSSERNFDQFIKDLKNKIHVTSLNE